MEIFDYIIVGAGSAGCALAARLSESGRHRVLLLEAGGKDDSFWIHMPMGTAKLFANPAVNWMYRSEPEPELDGRTLYQPRGKVLGGTGSINGMVYIRGHPADYDGWRQRGCVGWDWDSVLPYFKKSEDQQRGAGALHGVGGPIKVSDPANGLELADAWIAGAVEAGLPPNDDFNGPAQEGAGYLQSTTWRRRRWSSATAYLRPVRNRRNLAVRTNVLVNRVLTEGNRAVGVSYLRDGVEHIAHARGEIVVCGGAFNSPQILQRSGLGPGALLQDHGIPVVRDLPGVGANLHDHFCVRMQYRCAQPITLNDVANSPWRRIAAGLQYVLLRRGPLASNGFAAAVFARSDPRLERPDIQLILAAWSFARRDGKVVVAHPWPGFGVSVVHLAPDARGDVRITSADAKAPPAIRFNFLRSDHDVASMIAAMRLTREIARQPSFRRYVAAELFPGPEAETDAALRQCLRAAGDSNFHPVGTCRMGPNAGADVVDPYLRVYGMERLRVADASVMPTIPAGNTNAPTVMIAEKAADMILADGRSL